MSRLQHTTSIRYSPDPKPAYVAIEPADVSILSLFDAESARLKYLDFRYELTANEARQVLQRLYDSQYLTKNEQ